MANDQLRRAEENPGSSPNEGMVGGGGGDFRHENLGAPSPYTPDQMPEIMPPPQAPQDDDKSRTRDELEGRAKKKLEDKATGKGEGEGGKPGGKGPAEGSGTGTGGPGAGGEGGFGRAGGQAGEELGKKAAQKGAQQGAQTAARAGAGAAGEAGAGAAGTGAGAGAAGAGAGAAGAGAGAAGAGAGGAAAGGAAAGAAAGGTAAGAGVAATTGAETAGIGAAVGLGIVILSLGGAFVARNWKRLSALGAIVFVGVLILGVAFLNGLKPIASTVQTASKYMGPLQQIVDNRSVNIISRFITGASGAALAVHGQQERVATNDQQGEGEGRVLPATSDGLVTQGKLKTLFDAMKADGFEERMERRFGLTFEPGNGNIRILRFGQEIGVANSTAEAENILRNSFPDLQRMLNEEVNGWTWAQHTKVARPMRGAYDIQALAIPGAENAHDASQLVEIVKYQVSTVLRTGLNNMKRGLSCFVNGSDCNDFGIQVDPAAYSEYQDHADASLSQATQTTYDENLEGISPETNYLVPTLASSASERVKQEINNGEGTAIGLLGWLDIAAAAHKMSQKNDAQQLPSILRGKQAGALWAFNLSAINQMIAGDITGRASGLLTRNFRDIESSQAYNYVAYNNVSRGLGMLESNKVLSRLQRPFEVLYQHVLVENPLIQTTIGAAFSGWRILNGDEDVDIPIIGGIISGFLGGIGSMARPAIIALAEHTPLGSFMDRFAGFILQEVGILRFVEDTLGLSSKLMLPVCDPSDQSYNFFNCMASGAHNVANWACVEEFACQELTLAQKTQLLAASQADMQARVAAMPLWDRLFNQAVPYSMVNVAALHSPLPTKATENATAFAQSLFTTVWSAPQRIASLFSGSARAATADSSIIDGQDTFGIPLETLQETPLANQLSQANGTCPETEAGQPNMCKTDSSTVDSLIARYTYNPAYPNTDQAAGNDSPQVGNAQALAAAILASDNVTLGSSAEADIQRAANGQPTPNPCGEPTNLTSKALWVVNEAAKKYKFSINSVISGRPRCDDYHAQGKAVDVGNINNIQATPGNLSGTTYRNFASDIGKWIAQVAQYGGMGQKQCLGNISLPSSIYYGEDGCDHIHFSVDTNGSSF